MAAACAGGARSRRRVRCGRRSAGPRRRWRRPCSSACRRTSGACLFRFPRGPSGGSHPAAPFEAPQGRRWSDRFRRWPQMAAGEFGRPPSSLHVLNGYMSIVARKTSTGGRKMKQDTANMVGVDVSKSHLDAHRLRTGEAAQFGNDAAGFKELAVWIGAADCVVYEATGRYHRDFEEALVDAGLPLARANPLRARRFAQSMGRNAKTDAVDAAVLARMGADGRGAGSAADGAAGQGAARPGRPDGRARGAGAGPGGGAEPPQGPARGAARAAVPAAGADRPAAPGRRSGDRARAGWRRGAVAPRRDAGLHSGRREGHGGRAAGRDAGTGRPRRQGGGQPGRPCAGGARVRPVAGQALHPGRPRARAPPALHGGRRRRPAQPRSRPQVPAT